ncbi:MAG: SRPBCC family protein [Candidatus Kapabacteria bacterium]|nr:SRPBCC family protein [Ignavibacteriota bacterium]MCW5883808.1 SRPBCC family protein [Candidatus Kapabacteria bacterium]
MKYVKAILLIIVSMLILFLVVGIFMPDKYEIERSIIIDCPAEVVFWQAADLENFNKWNTWYEEEPSAYFPISGQPGEGQSSEWKGDIVGSGKLTNTSVKEFSRIEQELVFTEPFASEVFTWYDLKEINGKTEISWGASGNLSYPIERYMKVMIESGLNKSFNQGLANLKKHCEEICKQ